ncbi:MAG: response regulator [Clostridium sp.]|nr:MAG: response regulator [Clostridium sp.]
MKNSANLHGKKILLVEDNLINMEIATQIITKTGASVDSAYDGDEALELFNTNSYDLIFMDIQMPKKEWL